MSLRSFDFVSHNNVPADDGLTFSILPVQNQTSASAPTMSKQSSIDLTTLL